MSKRYKIPIRVVNREHHPNNLTPSQLGTRQAQALLQSREPTAQTPVHQDQVETRGQQRAQLLKDMLTVLDNLDRTLAASGQGENNDPLRMGVELTRRDMLHTLSQYGVTPLQALGQPFDPTWHEAVAVVVAEQLDVIPDTVVEVTEAGYQWHDKLLRPARVVVAQ